MNTQINSEDKKIKDIVSYLNNTRKASVQVIDGNMTLTEDDIVVLTAMKNPKGMLLKMLPDIYTYSDFGTHIDKSTLVFNTSESQSVLFQTDYTDFGEVLQTVKKAAEELNLYGYIIED